MLETPNWSRKPMKTVIRLEVLEGATLRSLARTLVLALVLAACDGDGGPTAPVGGIRGTYSGTWIHRAVVVSTGMELDLPPCPGSFTINDESDTTLSGSWVLDPTPDCDRSSGSFQGTRSGGEFTMVLDPDPLDIFEVQVEECTVLTRDDDFSGLVAGRDISLEASFTADCEIPQGVFRIQNTLLFVGSRPA
jgi:hypothetical protein